MRLTLLFGIVLAIGCGESGNPLGLEPADLAGTWWSESAVGGYDDYPDLVRLLGAYQAQCYTEVNRQLATGSPSAISATVRSLVAIIDSDVFEPAR